MKVGFLRGYLVAPKDQRAKFICDLQSRRWLAHTQKSPQPQTSWAGQAQISNFSEATMFGELCTFFHQIYLSQRDTSLRTKRRPQAALQTSRTELVIGKGRLISAASKTVRRPAPSRPGDTLQP